jgi:hypothetical protein
MVFFFFLVFLIKKRHFTHSFKSRFVAAFEGQCQQFCGMGAYFYLFIYLFILGRWVKVGVCCCMCLVRGGDGIGAGGGGGTLKITNNFDRLNQNKIK